MTQVFKNSFFLFVAIACLAVAGCSQSTEAKKLTPPDDIDWAAIEAEGEEMNNLQSEGE